jgi:uncharacterized membrane protein/uncharacterized RDD family membrane protein YckC
VVDSVQLATDILSNTISLALPGLLWALLFLLAWEREPFAESIGFGRRSFWLLLPGAVLATLAYLPIAPVSTDWTAVSFGGAIFPLLVGLLAFGRAAPPRSRSLALYLGLLAVEGGALFVLVLPSTVGLSNAMATAFGTSNYAGNDLVVTFAAVVFTVIVGAVALGTQELLVRRVAFLSGLTTLVLVMTFVVSSAIPGVGITESFPFYLLPPVAVGFLAVGFARRVFPGEPAFGLPTAFLASTFGVLLGADLLRQPPLYGTGPSGVYTIGGAGVLDLVYLSGLIGFGSAYLAYWALGLDFAPVGAPTPARELTPFARLGRAFRDGLDGRLEDALQGSAAASRSAAAQAHRLLGISPAPEDRPWQDIGVPGWVVADQANLESAARTPTTDGREGFRAWLTARWLVLIARDLGQRRFATIWSRVAAFLTDLTVVTLPAVAVWTVILETTPGGLAAALQNVTFNAAIFGFIAWAFLYFVLTEAFGGATLGKRLFGLEVRERTLDPATGLSALVRNTTVLPVLTVIGIGVALALAFGLKSGSSTSLAIAGVSLPSGFLVLVAALAFVLGGVLLLGTGALLFIAATSDRQRLGDLWAGTWVVRREPFARPVAVPTAASAPPEPPPPAAPGQSG